MVAIDVIAKSQWRQEDGVTRKAYSAGEQSHAILPLTSSSSAQYYGPMQPPFPHEWLPPLDFPCEKDSSHDSDQTDWSQMSRWSVEEVFLPDNVESHDGSFEWAKVAALIQTVYGCLCLLDTC